MQKTSDKTRTYIALAITVVVWGGGAALIGSSIFGDEPGSERAENKKIRRNVDTHIAEARAAIDSGDLTSARRLMNRMDQAGATHGLNDAYTAKRLEQEAQAATRADATRVEGIAQALASERCVSWDQNVLKLRKIKAEEVTPEAERAAERLELCRQEALKETEARLASHAGAMRLSVKSNLDAIFLADGLDVTVTIRGDRNTKIILRNPLFHNRIRPMEYADEGVTELLEDRGFEEVVFTNGSFSHSYKLTPKSPEKLALKEFSTRGLHVPFRLPRP